MAVGSEAGWIVNMNPPQTSYSDGSLFDFFDDEKPKATRAANNSDVVDSGTYSGDGVHNPVTSALPDLARSVTLNLKNLVSPRGNGEEIVSPRLPTEVLNFRFGIMAKSNTEEILSQTLEKEDEQASLDLLKNAIPTPDQSTEVDVLLSISSHSDRVETPVSVVEYGEDFESLHGDSNDEVNEIENVLSRQSNSKDSLRDQVPSRAAIESPCKPSDRSGTPYSARPESVHTETLTARNESITATFTQLTPRDSQNVSRSSSIERGENSHVETTSPSEGYDQDFDSPKSGRSVDTRASPIPKSGDDEDTNVEESAEISPCPTPLQSPRTLDNVSVASNKDSTKSPSSAEETHFANSSEVEYDATNAGTEESADATTPVDCLPTNDQQSDSDTAESVDQKSSPRKTKTSRNSQQRDERHGHQVTRQANSCPQVGKNTNNSVKGRKSDSSVSGVKDTGNIPRSNRVITKPFKKRSSFSSSYNAHEYESDFDTDTATVTGSNSENSRDVSERSCKHRPLPDSLKGSPYYRSSSSRQKSVSRSGYENGTSPVSLPLIDPKGNRRMIRRSTVSNGKYQRDSAKTTKKTMENRKKLSKTPKRDVQKAIKVPWAVAMDPAEFSPQIVSRVNQTVHGECDSPEPNTRVAACGFDHSVAHKSGVPVRLKAEAIYKDGQLEISVTGDERGHPVADNMAVKITVIHKFPGGKQPAKTGANKKFQNSRRYGVAKSRWDWKKEGPSNRHVLKHRAVYGQFNTNIDPEASERYMQYFGY